VTQELDRRIREDVRKSGDFARIHPLPRSGADVPDDFDARLVVLDSEHPYTKDADSAAAVAAKAILESRGNTPRLYQNTLVFLAADKIRLQDLEEALRKYLAWTSILNEQKSLNLSPFQVKQAETQQQAADGAVAARLPETFQWLLIPEQAKPQSQIQWQAIRVAGSDALAVRASKKLRGDELLLTSFGSTILRKHLDDVPLWRGDHVPVRQLVDDFARYLYLPRLANPEVLTQAIRDGAGLLTWQTDTFAYAESFDEPAKRYRGLRAGKNVTVEAESAALVVKPDVARRQIEAESKPQPPGSGPIPQKPGDKDVAPPQPPPEPETKLKRFHGTVKLDPTRAGRDASRIADEVIAHLVGQVGAEVSVTLEIEAELPSGATDQVVRTVTENSRTLKFTSHGFEKE